MRGRVTTWLRLEGAAALGIAVLLYAQGGFSWVLFAVLFFVPDVSFVGYLRGPRIGAGFYNALHSYVGPLLLGIGSLLAGGSPAVPLIWAAHIGFDRTLGYGLKYPTGFTDTHLGALQQSRDADGDRLTRTP